MAILSDNTGTVLPVTAARDQTRVYPAIIAPRGQIPNSKPQIQKQESDSAALKSVLDCGASPAKMGDTHMVWGNISKALLSICMFAGMVAGLMPAAEAGTLGNGHMSKPVAKAHYTFCWGAWPRNSTAYFSAVITSAPSLANPSFEAPFRSYLHKTFSVGAATECFISLTMDGAVAGKKQEEASLATEQKMKIVETEWQG